MQLKALAQVAMFLTCGVEFAGSNFGRDSLCHEIFSDFPRTFKRKSLCCPIVATTTFPTPLKFNESSRSLM